MSNSRKEILGEYYLEAELAQESEASQLLLANMQMLLYEVDGQALHLSVIDCKTGSTLRNKTISLPSTKFHLFPLNNDCLAIAAWRHGDFNKQHTEISQGTAGWSFYLVNASTADLQTQIVKSTGDMLGDSDDFNLNHKIKVFPDGNHWVIWSSDPADHRFALIDTSAGFSQRIVDTKGTNLQIFPLSNQRMAVWSKKPKSKLELYHIDFGAIENWASIIVSKPFSALLPSKKHDLSCMTLSPDENWLAVEHSVGLAKEKKIVLDFYNTFDANFLFMDKKFSYDFDLEEPPHSSFWMPNSNALVVLCSRSITYINPSSQQALGFLSHSRHPKLSMSADGMLASYVEDGGYKFYDASSLRLYREQLKEVQQSQSSFAGVHSFFPSLAIKKLLGKVFQPSARLPESLQAEMKQLHARFSFQKTKGDKNASTQCTALEYLSGQLDWKTIDGQHQSCQSSIENTVKNYPGLLGVFGDIALKKFFKDVKACDVECNHTHSGSLMARMG
jgi:hypothetical protein